MGTSTILRTANKQRLTVLGTIPGLVSTDFVDNVTGIVPNTVSLCLFAVLSIVEVGNNTRLPIPSIFSMSIPEQSTLAPVSATATVFLAGKRAWLLMVFVSSCGILCSLRSVLQCVGSNFTEISMLQALCKCHWTYVPVFLLKRTLGKTMVPPAGGPGGCAVDEYATPPLAPPLLRARVLDDWVR